VLWEQQFYGSQLACTGGSSCFLSARQNGATIAVDPLGNIYAGGNTNTIDFPTTPGAFLERGYGPYILKLSPAGQVLWSTYLTNNRVGIGYPVGPADTLTAIAAGPDGNVYFAGGGSPNWPVTPGAYKTKYEGPEWPPFGPPGPRNAYVAKMNGAGTALVYSTFIGHNDSMPNSIAVDAAGIAFVSSAGVDLYLADYISAVNATGSSLLLDNTYASGSRGTQIAIDATGRLHAVGGAAGVVTIVDRTPAASGLFGVVNAAGPSVVGRVARGELISIYGWSLGDRVFFDDLSAPVLYSSSDQINAIVPFSVTGQERVTISVRKNGIETGKAVVALTEAQPEIFTLASRQAAALNEDGSVNSNSNPAKAGSLITVWGTGTAGWPSDITPGATNPLSPLLWLSFKSSAKRGGSF
jgi:beta-propeller repeat-containing protein